MSFLYKVFYLSLFIFSLSGCSRYTFDINNNQVYIPASIYTDYVLEDAKLESCIRQAIQDTEITKSTELNQLRCSYAGIISLSGIAQFSRLNALSLKGNPIVDGSELLKLTHLNFLDISDTKILDCQIINQISSLLNNQDSNTSSLIHSANC